MGVELVLHFDILLDFVVFGEEYPLTVVEGGILGFLLIRGFDYSG